MIICFKGVIKNNSFSLLAFLFLINSQGFQGEVNASFKTNNHILNAKRKKLNLGVKANAREKRK